MKVIIRNGDEIFEFQIKSDAVNYLKEYPESETISESELVNEHGSKWRAFVKYKFIPKSIPNTKTNLFTLRNNAGLSRDALSDMSGISVSALQMIENGRRTPSYRTAKKLASILQCDIDELITEDE